jgi:hypothetical protein
MIKLFADEDQYRHHVAIEDEIEGWIGDVLSRVCQWWKPTYRITEWWESELHPGRMIVNYYIPELHEGDGQLETALGIMWSDDPQKCHDEVQKQLGEEHRALVAAARAREKKYMLVPDTEAGERAYLHELLAKYPDEVGGIIGLFYSRN